MRNFAVVLFAVTVVLGLYSIPAQAGDDAIAQITVSADAGAGNECSAILRPKTNYAIQPGVDVYVKMGTDGGAQASSVNVKVEAGKLYDTPTTATQRYICVKPVANGSASSVNIFQYRSPTE